MLTSSLAKTACLSKEKNLKGDMMVILVIVHLVGLHKKLFYFALCKSCYDSALEQQTLERSLFCGDGIPQVLCKRLCSHIKVMPIVVNGACCSEAKI